jgi:type II secretory pathway pseudopilin PulG
MSNSCVKVNLQTGSPRAKARGLANSQPSPSPSSAHFKSRRALTLIELVVVIVAIAIATPPALNALDAAVARRTDRALSTFAATLAGSVIDQVMADVCSDAPGLGFTVLNDPATYIDGSSGLRARLASVTQPYIDRGLSFSLTIGPLTAYDGSTTGDSAQDVFRLVTVSVTIPSSNSPPATLRAAVLLTDI